MDRNTSNLSKNLLHSIKVTKILLLISKNFFNYSLPRSNEKRKEKRKKKKVEKKNIKKKEEKGVQFAGFIPLKCL